jgi:hypothetical protein
MSYVHKSHHTFMYLWLVGAVLVLVTGMAGYALQHPRTALAPVVETPGLVATTTPVSTDTTGTFTLALAEKGESHGWAVTPLTVIEDSRCPIDVQCIQAGTVQVKTRIATSAESEVVLTLLTPVIVGTSKVTLLNVTPKKSSTEKVVQKDYRFTFLVEQL